MKPFFWIWAVLVAILFGMQALYFALEARGAQGAPPRCQMRDADSGTKALLPDAQCTPGKATGLSLQSICTTSTKARRNVSQATKRAVLESYGIFSRGRDDLEVDHLVPLELGGSNDVDNLWPQPADPRPGFHEKDRVEDWAHRQVCSGKMTLERAQQQIAADWTVLYREMNHP